MECKHPRIKSENCVLICCECGAVLPKDYLNKPKTAQEAPKKPRKRAKKEE